MLERQNISRSTFLRLAGAGIITAGMGLLAGCSSGNGGSSDSGSSTGSSSSAGNDLAGDYSAVSDTTVGQKPKCADIEQISNTLFVFDTIVTLTASCPQETLDKATDRCNYFESIFSRTKAKSDIGKINAAQGKPVRVHRETADIVKKALKYCKASNGRFDITIGAASSLWDFKKKVVPSAASLKEAVKHIDYTKVDVDGRTITLADPKAKLDLGGIAKGYIADDLAELFLNAGCDSACINLGGNVKTVGVKPDGSAWHVGIQDPNSTEGTVVAAAYSHDTSLVTSGLYERQFTKKGKKYWHILDPKTGYPVKTDLISATIISSASIDGDGYTKPLFMVGHDKALSWINEHDGLEGLVVDTKGTITQSNGNVCTLV